MHLFFFYSETFVQNSHNCHQKTNHTAKKTNLRPKTFNTYRIIQVFFRNKQQVELRFMI